MMKQIKAVVFDLGNVVFHINWKPVLAEFAKLAGKEVNEFPWSDELMNLYEVDAISTEEFKAQLEKNLNCNFSLAEFDFAWNSIYEKPLDGIENLILELNKEYRIIALSNTNEAHQKYWEIRYKSLLQHFEKVFASNEMKLRKPNADCFEAVVKYLDLKPKEVLFLDDTISNIEGADAMGIRTIHVSSAKKLHSEISSILKL